jgi:hypothetical protein
MPALIAAADAHIDAPASLVLEILRDFDGHHRRILPDAFSDFEVIHGGREEGTRTRFKFRMGGRTTDTRTLATEPEPGVIREQVLDRDMVTVFRVQAEGDGAHVTISTEWTPQAGLSGRLERLFAPSMMRRIYDEELGLIADYAGTLASDSATLIVTSLPLADAAH